MVDKRVAGFGSLLLIDFLISIVMLVTDKNLQTDFGSLSPPPYYLHWYGVLAMGTLDLIAGGVLLAIAGLPSLRGRAPALQRFVVVGALVWTILAIVAMVGIVETYQQVGFNTAGQFAQYLFGTTTYAGLQPYIPWLYDLLLAAYVVTAIVGLVAVLRARTPAVSPTVPSSGA